MRFAHMNCCRLSISVYCVHFMHAIVHTVRRCMPGLEGWTSVILWQLAANIRLMCELLAYPDNQGQSSVRVGPEWCTICLEARPKQDLYTELRC